LIIYNAKKLITKINVGLVPLYYAAIHTQPGIFLNWSPRLHRPWQTFTPILFFVRFFDFGLKTSTNYETDMRSGGRTDGRTDERARRVLRRIRTAAQ